MKTYRALTALAAERRQLAMAAATELGHLPKRDQKADEDHTFILNVIADRPLGPIG